MTRRRGRGEARRAITTAANRKQLGQQPGRHRRQDRRVRVDQPARRPTPPPAPREDPHAAKRAETQAQVVRLLELQAEQEQQTTTTTDRRTL